MFWIGMLLNAQQRGLVYKPKNDLFLRGKLIDNIIKPISLSCSLSFALHQGVFVILQVLSLHEKATEEPKQLSLTL